MHSMLVESGYTRGIMEEIGGKRNDTDGHSCSICGKTFPFQSSLSQHMRKHTGEKPYKCPYCPHRAAQKGALKAHIRSHKMGTLSHGFEESDIEMGVSEGLDGCASPTESTSACNDVAEGKKSVSHRCSICRKKLRSRAELQHHVHLLHKPFRCRLCSYEVLREDQLLSHIEKTHITVEASVPEADTDSALLPAQKSMSSFGHICQVCGRRFRETWFLKNHMKTHGSKTSSKGKPRGNLDAVTINEVLQEEVTMGNTLCLFKLCPKCGHLFHNQENLRIHQRVHSHSHLFNGKRPRSQRKQDRDGTLSSKSQFMECLKLMPVATAQLRNQQKLGSRIPELDPICSYQAWQLATKGRVVEATESGKRLGWEDIPADEAYDQERGEYTLVRQYKGKKELDSQNCQGQNSENPIPLQKNNRTGQSSVPKEVEKSPDLSLESQRDLDIETSTLRSRHFSQSTTNECFKCGKMFHTHHQMLLHCLHCNGVFGSRVSPESSKGESAYASCSSSPEYESSTPYSSPGEHVTTKGTEGAQVPTLDLPLLPSVGTEAAPLDLSVQSDAQMFESEDRLLSHRCTRCPYSTYYPEVLWIHQRIAHQAHSGAHAGRAAAKRRTGPPPALGGQESPPFPPTQVPRTAPPVSGGSRNPTNHAKGANATPKPSRVKKRRLQVEAQLQGYTVPGEGLGCVLSQTSSRTTRHKRVAHTPSLKNCNSQQRATRYHQPGSSKGSKLKQTDVFASLTSPPADAAPPARPAAGMPRSPQRQGDYLCRECGKHFSQAAGLQRHARSHTGEWPFHCCYCSYTSSLKGDLKSNVQREPRSAFNTVRHNNKLEHPQLPETSTLAKEPLPSA